MACSAATLRGATSLGGLGKSLLSPSVATATTHRAFPQLQRRFLGNEVRGPDFDPLNVKTWNLRPHMEIVCRSVSQPALSYNEFKQFCESFRLLLFVGGSAAIAVNMLICDPTRSAYWRLYSPLKWPALLFRPFRGPKGTKGVFDFEQTGLSKGPDGAVKTAAFAAFERTMC